MTASHENGAVESLIKSARQALAAFFKESSLYRETVQNVLTRHIRSMGDPLCRDLGKFACHA